MPLVENALEWLSTPNGKWHDEARLSPSGLSEQTIVIQWLSFHLQYSMSSLWIFSIAMIERSSIKWSNRLKCLGTGISIQWWFMSNWWPVSCMRSPFSVSPTIHWIEHFCILWSKWRYWSNSPQSVWPETLSSVVVLQNVIPNLTCTHFAVWLSTSAVPPICFF